MIARAAQRPFPGGAPDRHMTFRKSAVMRKKEAPPMKNRLLSALLACLMLLGGTAFADGTDVTVLAAGGMGVFTDCVVTVNEIAWYGEEQSNLLTPAANGAPAVFAIRAQVLNRNMARLDLALNSSLRVRYGTAYDQTGVIAEEALVSGDGLYFVRASSIFAEPLQPKNIVAFVRVSPLLYYSAAQLDVQLTLAGHVMQISLDPGAAQTQPQTVTPPPAQPGNQGYAGPIVVNPPAAGQPDARIPGQPQGGAVLLKVPVSYMDVNQALLLNPTYLEVPQGGMALLTPQEIPGFVYDHYSFLQNGQWQDGYGMSVAVYTDQRGVPDKQQIYLVYRRGQPAVTDAPRPVYSASQIVRPIGWDTQFRPGVSTAPDGRGDNANVYRQLGNLYDDNPGTSVSWLLYVTERTDGLPEFTASFGGTSISAIGVRNGKATSESEFLQYARLASLHLRIHTTSGEVLNTWVYLPDEYSPDYRVLPLDKTYRNVASVELWIEGNVNQGFYLGTGETMYTMHVSDIQFYFGSPAVPTRNPYEGAGNSY